MVEMLCFISPKVPLSPLLYALVTFRHLLLEKLIFLKQLFEHSSSTLRKQLTNCFNQISVVDLR